MSVRDGINWLLFEIGADYYARKLASGPEAELRGAFAGFLAPSAGADVLDVGCGPGHLTRDLAVRGCRVTGVDRSRRLLGIARRLAAREGLKVEFRRARADRLPFGDSTFDLVVAATVIYVLSDPLAVLKEMARVTRAGGAVASLDPHASMTVPAMREYAAGHRLNREDTRKLVVWAQAARFYLRFTEDQIRALLTAAGLTNLRLERRLDGLVWFSHAIKPEAARPASNLLS